MNKPIPNNNAVELFRALTWARDNRPLLEALAREGLRDARVLEVTLEAVRIGVAVEPAFAPRLIEAAGRIRDLVGE